MMMNPFQYPISDDELYFQIPSDNNYYSLPIQQAAAAAEEDNNQILQVDPKTMMDGSSVPPRTNQKGKGKGKQRTEDYNHHQMDQNENKKWMHREIEKQRRQEMARLCTTFRSLLPLHYIKGKRSTSDHMHEGVNYIKDLQEKVQQLQAKRDELMKLCDETGKYLNNNNNNNSTSHQIPTFVIVEPFCGGIQIKCSYSLRSNDAFPLSRVLDILLKQGLHFLNSTSTKTHHDSRIIHTIRSEDPYMRTETYYTELQRKLAEAISSSSS